MGRKSQSKKVMRNQKKQTKTLPDNKTRWRSTPLKLWLELSEEAQDKMWTLQLDLCCKASEKEANNINGYFDVLVGEEGYCWEWITLEENDEQLKEFRKIDKADPSGYRSFWVCIHGSPLFLDCCYQMRYPCDLAINDLI